MYNLYKKAYTPWEWQEKIFRHAEELGLICFSTPFDDTSVDFLEGIGCPIYKIASFENIDISENAQYVVIYLPETTKIYYIVATITYDESHILYYNDFSSEEGFNRFFDKVYSSTGDEVQLVEDARPQFGDNVLILSTCLRTDRTRRFLVIAKEIT